MINPPTGAALRKEDLTARIKSFALRVSRLYFSLPKMTEAQVLGKQLLHSGTSVGAHYRKAYRARSYAEFIAKIEGGLQELDESVYWMELLMEANIIKESRLTGLLSEADQLLAIFVSSAKTAKGNLK